MFLPYCTDASMKKCFECYLVGQLSKSILTTILDICNGEFQKQKTLEEELNNYEEKELDN